MPAKKNKRKPKAMQQLVQKHIDEMVADLLFAAVGNDDHVQPLFKNRTPPRSTAQAAIDSAIKKRCTRVAFLTKLCRNEQGVEYMAEPVEVETSSCLPSEAAGVFQQHLDGITHNPKHYICDAYIIANRSTVISEAFAARIFEQMNGWHGLAAWQEKHKTAA